LFAFWIGGISNRVEKRKSGEIEILKIPPILKILILTKTRGAWLRDARSFANL